MANPVLPFTPDDSESRPRRIDVSQPQCPARTLLTVPEAARLIGQCTRTIRRHIKSQRIKAVKLNRAYRIWSTDLYAALTPVHPADEGLDDFIRQSTDKKGLP